jgi:hypothetical protein
VAELSRKIQDALDEGRILILGTQVLLGFELRSFLEPGFEELPEWARSLKLVALCVMTSTFALLVLPGAAHRISERGEDTGRLHRLTTATLDVALLPLGLGLSLDVLVALAPVLGGAGAVGAGVAASALALGCWYGWTTAARGRVGPRRRAREDEMAPPNLDDKIRHVLTEARMLLPGVQALLGFQLAATLLRRFAELPREAQLLHAGTIGLTVLSMVLLVAPAAYHRIVEDGENTERFHRVASRLLVAALPPLGLAISAELGIATYVVTGERGGAIAAGTLAAVGIHATWFGVTLALRSRRSPRLRRAAARA